MSNIELNGKKGIGFEYVTLNMKQVDREIARRARTEKITIINEGKHWIAVSATCPEVYYKLDLLCDNTGFCTCPSFIHTQSKKGLPCKHIVALDRHITATHRQQPIVRNHEDITDRDWADKVKPPVFVPPTPDY